MKKRQKRARCTACDKPISGRVVRGCHQYCYRQLLVAIQSGKATDAKLVRAGKLREKGRSGRPRKNIVTREFGL